MINFMIFFFASIHPFPLLHLLCRLSSMANHDDPFYLHFSEHLGVVLVSQPLVDDNFNSWRCAMLMALEGKNWAGYMDDTLPKLEEN